MTTPGGTAERASARGADPASLRPTLERFWPSRRGHAFDEFCR